jgi:hypothetical protein
MSKTIQSLYLDAYASLAAKQHAKYGNPTAQQSPAPDHVPNVIETAVRDGTLTTDQGRKLAVLLGKKAYGEVGLTSGVVNAAIEQVCGFGALDWQVKGQLESRLCGY